MDRDARPLILALSNPDTLAECTADEAYRWSGGRAVFASGTIFPPISTVGGEQYVASQANNSLIFPGAAPNSKSRHARVIANSEAAQALKGQAKTFWKGN
jgi:malate dehydrogenase (oxaloacetate-decarboxylating)(NADP+)